MKSTTFDQSVANVGKIVDDYFNASDYANDNLPDLIYGCLKIILVLLLIKQPISHKTKCEDNFNAFFEQFINLLDLLFMRLRLVLSRTENYSGGKFLEDIKSLPDFSKTVKSLFVLPNKRPGKIVIVESKDLKKKSIIINGTRLDPKQLIDKIYTSIPTDILSIPHIIEYKKSIQNLYKSYYDYDGRYGNYPKFIADFQRERFHQNKHSNNKKYQILIHSDTPINVVTRRFKPNVNWNEIFQSLEDLSKAIDGFANLCSYYYGNILTGCNVHHQRLDMLINNLASIYNYEFDAKKVEVTVLERIPALLKITGVSY